MSPQSRLLHREHKVCGLPDVSPVCCISRTHSSHARTLGVSPHTRKHTDSTQSEPYVTSYHTRNTWDAWLLWLCSSRLLNLLFVDTEKYLCQIVGLEQKKRVDSPKLLYYFSLSVASCRAHSLFYFLLILSLDFVSLSHKMWYHVPHLTPTHLLPLSLHLNKCLAWCSVPRVSTKIKQYIMPPVLSVPSYLHWLFSSFCQETHYSLLTDCRFPLMQARIVGHLLRRLLSSQNRTL